MSQIDIPTKDIEKTTSSIDVQRRDRKWFLPPIAGLIFAWDLTFINLTENFQKVIQETNDLQDQNKEDQLDRARKVSG